MTIKKDVGKKDVTFNVTEEIFKLTPRGNGKQVRLDLGAWNGGDEKYELRIWVEKDGESKATKGLGLTGAELLELRDKLNELDFES
jgi:hypothetical protein